MMRLFKRAHLKEVYFVLGKIAPAASGQILLGEACEINAVKLGHAVAELFEYATHYAVSARMNFDAGLVAVGFGCVAYCIGMDRSVVKFYAVGNCLHILFGYVLVGPYVINLFLHKLGVCELRGKIAVVREEQHACGVAVKASNGIDALVAGTFHKVKNSGASVRVVGCRYAILRLVEQDIGFALQGHYLLIIFNHVGAGDFCSEFGYNLTVYLNKALTDEFVGLAARAYTGVGHVFVKANLFVWIGNGLFVFNRFRARDEALASLWHAELISGRALLAVLTVGVVEARFVAALIVVEAGFVAALLAALIVESGFVAALLAAFLVVESGFVATLIVVESRFVAALLISVGVVEARFVAALLISVGVVVAGFVAALLSVAVVIARLITALIIVVARTIASLLPLAVIVITRLVTVLLIVARLISTLMFGRGAAFARAVIVAYRFCG